mmetsp:Transcript_22690/g.56081  ORF Transcript_22690/g.56081 Transcript_22690/m.56081 type:complete len:237 (+) Transcript_22690:3-713(+)
MPYLRGPQSQFDNEDSNYRHIGRRYLYTGSDSTTDDASDSPFVVVCLVAFISMIFGVLLFFLLSGRSEDREREAADAHETQNESNVEPVQTQLDRKHLIGSKLHYQIVLTDRSNLNIDILRGDTEEKDDDDTITNSDDGDDCSTIASDHGKKASVRTGSISSYSSIYHRVQNLFSLRSLRPKQEDVYSICLEEYCPGQTICAAKNACCNHMFHDACIRSWLTEHDYCPLCRRDVME